MKLRKLTELYIKKKGGLIDRQTDRETHIKRYKDKKRKIHRERATI